MKEQSWIGLLAMYQHAVRLRRLAETDPSSITSIEGRDSVKTSQVHTSAFGSEPTFSLLHLGDQYAAATTAVERSQLLAAGKAIIAADLWHSTGMYMAGILLQGSGMMIAVIMLRNHDFSKITAYAGLLGNALDLLQHVLHPVAPSLQESLTPIMGIFYLTWYPMLARDLLRLARGRSSDKT